MRFFLVRLIDLVLLPLCGISSNETRSIIVAPGQGVTDAPIMAAGVDCNAKILTDFFYSFQTQKTTGFLFFLKCFYFFRVSFLITTFVDIDNSLSVQLTLLFVVVLFYNFLISAIRLTINAFHTDKSRSFPLNP